MNSVGGLAVSVDLRSFDPAPIAATALPVEINLAAVLQGRPLLHYCQERDAASIVASGLDDGSWCTVTPLSSYVADIWLGTPKRKDYVIVLDPSVIPAFQGPGVAPPEGSDPLRQGTAVEFYLPQGAPATAIADHRPLEQP
jgi:hypothetical protein